MAIDPLMEERKQCVVELLWPLQRRKMAYTGQNYKLCIRNTLSQIFSVFALNEFIVLTLHESDPSTVVIDVALVIGDGQRPGSVRFELSKVVVVRFHDGPPSR